MRAVRQWCDELPPGDAIALRCECADAEKQFRAWKLWFKRHEDPRWQVSEEFKSFLWYKPRGVDLTESENNHGVSNPSPSTARPGERYYGLDAHP